MNVVDSSAWLEYFAGGEAGDFFAPAIEDIPRLVTPAVTIYEVFKRVLQQRSENEAIQAAVHMQQGMVVPLDAELAMTAAKLGHELKLPLADSIILATARAHEAILWTQDAHFEGLEGVRFRGRRA
jgi:predicted nucleic acid-binding protein